MTCGSCGATIADKAIVCYKCGAPTAGPAAPRPAAGRGSRQGAIASAILALALGTMTFVLPADSTSQVVAGVGAVLASASTGWLWLRGRR